jgi:hypothetical protein
MNSVSDAAGFGEHVQGLFTEKMNAQNGAGKGTIPRESDPVHVFTPFIDEDNLDDDEEL